MTPGQFEVKMLARSEIDSLRRNNAESSRHLMAMFKADRVKTKWLAVLCLVDVESDGAAAGNAAGAYAPESSGIRTQAGAAPRLSVRLRTWWQSTRLESPRP